MASVRPTPPYYGGSKQVSYVLQGRLGDVGRTIRTIPSVQERAPFFARGWLSRKSIGGTVLDRPADGD